MDDPIGRHNVGARQMDAVLAQQDLTLDREEMDTCVNVKQLMCRKKLRRDTEEPISNTYILRHSDGDNLIGHRLNSRERSQRIDSQLWTDKKSSSI